MLLTNEIFLTKFRALQKFTNKELPFCISKVLLKNVIELREGQKIFETARLKIAKELAEKDEKGKVITKEGKYEFSAEGEKEFEKQHDELLKIEKEYDIELLELPEDFKISSADLLILKDVVIKL